MLDRSGSDADDRFVPLDLPEQGQVALPVAGVATRVVAALLDTSLVLLGATAVLMTLTLGDAPAADGTLAGGAAMLLLGLGPVLVPMLFELAWRGQTPGKRWMGLRVLSVDGSPVSVGQVLLRNVLRVVDFLPLGYFVGTLAVFASVRGQRLGDLVAGTLVIREDPAALADLAAGSLASLEVGLELRGLSPSLVRAIQLLAAPWRQLGPAVRQQRIAEVLAAARRERPDLANEADPELWDRLRRGVGLVP